MAMTPKPKRFPSLLTRRLLGRADLRVWQLEDRVVPAGTITGTIFTDFNGNGAFDSTQNTLPNNGSGTYNTAVDVPFGAGITVTAYDSSNTVRGTATSDAAGNYTLNVAGTGPYRLHFSGLPATAGTFYGPAGTSNGTTIRFVADPAGGTLANINIGIVQNAQFTQDNPLLITNRYVFGALNGDNAAVPTVQSFPYSAGRTIVDRVNGDGVGSLPEYQNPTTHAINIPYSQVGATWGLAEDENTARLFLAAFMKRHTDFGPGGPGAIYTANIPPTSQQQTPNVTTTATLLVDLNAATDLSGNVGLAGGTSFRGANHNFLTDGLVDNVGWDAVGKLGLGGVDVSTDGRFLFTVGLNTRRLYVLDTTTLQVRSYAIPVFQDAATGVTGITQNNPQGDLRPFAVSWHNGSIYVGAVNSAESTYASNDLAERGDRSRLRAYVFRFAPGADPVAGGSGQFVDLGGTATTAPVLNIPLDYQRGYTHPGATASPADDLQSEWLPWSPVYRNLNPTLNNPPGQNLEAVYPQPMLTGLAFDAAGNVVLGFRDRAGDQFGAFTPADPNNPNNFMVGITAGDMLRAFGNPTTGWVLENGGADPRPGSPGGASATGTTNLQGPGGGEFYNGEYLVPGIFPGIQDHNEIAVGGVLQVPGFPDVLSTVFDPAQVSQRYNAGGVRWFANSGADAGQALKAYELYQVDIQLPNPPPLFAKANGIGDLVAFSNPIIEIGNRIWNDGNRNGIQDANEAGIANLLVFLLNDAGQTIGTATTDGTGNYYFTNAPLPANPVPGKAYLSPEDDPQGNRTGFVPGRQYTVRVPVNQAPLAGLSLTTQNAVIAGVNDPDSIDSDAALVAGNADVAIAALLAGEVNHTYDIGFNPPPILLSVGDFVWNDANNDGQWQQGEAGIADVRVQLVNLTTGTTLTQQTNAQGGYLFTGLEPGQYQVQIPFSDPTNQPNLVGWYSSTGAFTVNTGPFEPVIGDPANNLDHGTTNGALTFVTGPVLNLTVGGAPLNEITTAPGDLGFPEAVDQDANSYRNQDFGFWQPVSIGDRVWIDANNNGLRDAGEAPLANVTVQLLNSAGAVVADTKTNAEGGYLFTFLQAGDYRVRLVRDAVLDGFTSSTGTIGSSTGPFEPVIGDPANDNDHGTQITGFINGPQITAKIGGATIVDPATIPAGLPFDPAGPTSRYRNQDFGVFAPLALGDFVWIDANNNGVLDQGEQPLENVPVELLDAAGNPLLDANGQAITTATDAAGNYLFANLIPGQYRVRITPPPGFVTSTGSNGSLVGPYEPGKSGFENNEDHGTNDTLVAGRIIASVVTLGQPGDQAANPDKFLGFDGRANLRQDFGLFQPVSIGDLVWEDVNNDGKRQATEAPLAGVSVRLLDANGNAVLGGVDGKTPLLLTTDAKGGYIFNSLAPGQYRVAVQVPTGYTSSTGTVGSLTGPFEPVNGDPANNLDHGTTQPGGLVVFGPIINAQVGQAPLDDLDGPPVNDLSPNENSYRNQDFGFFRPLILGDFVWEDINNNGVLDATEPPVAGVPVELLDGNGNPLLDAGGKAITTVTDTAGKYLFTNLIPGDYRVRITPPAGYITSTGKLGSFDSGPFEPGVTNFVNNEDHGTRDTAIAGRVSTAKVTLGLPGDTTLNPDSLNGDEGRGNLRQDFGIFRPLSLGNLVFRDVSNNGVFDPGTDTGIAGVTVRLLDSANNVLATQTTDANGEYLFTLLSPGDYRVEIVPPAGLTTSTGNGFPATVPGPFEPAAQSLTDSVDKGTLDQLTGTIRTPIVTLALPGDPANPDNSGLANLRQDFGLITRSVFQPPPASISGHVYVDNNINGIREPGEAPIGGTRIYLDGVTTTGLTVSQTTFTDTTGFYQFTNLPPGTYTVREEQPAGFFYDGLETLGTVGGVNRGTAGNDIFRTIVLNAGDNGINYDFAEIQPVSTFGHVWVDTNRNAIREPGESPIPNVAVTISGTAFAGTILERPLTAADVPNGLTQFTNAQGRYDFAVLPPGLYNLAETQPVDFDDWREQNGDPYGPAVGIANDLFSGIALTAGSPIRGPFNFGEVLSQAENPPNRSPQSPADPTKREFLSSTEDPSSAGAVRRQAAFTLPPEEVQPSPGIAAPVAALPLQPRFAVATGIPTQPTYVATGSGPGITPMVRVFDYATGIEKFRLQAYESGYTGGVRTAVGDVNGDGTADIITATGIGGGPRIRVFNGRDGSVLQDFFAYESTYTGGVSLAVGDIDGDGNADIIAGTDQGGGPRVRVFSGSTGLTLLDFFAFDSSQRGGVRVAAADFNGDGRDDIVATTGAGVPTQVRVFDAATQTVLTQFQPYGNAFTGGATVAAGDFNGDGTPDIITGADAGGGPHVQVFSGLTGVSVASFFAVDPSFTGGVRVAAADLNGDGRVELITGAGMSGAARVSIYSGAGISLVDDFFAYDIDHLGGVYVGAGTGRGVTNPPPNSTPAALGQLGNPGSLPPL